MLFSKAPDGWLEKQNPLPGINPGSGFAGRCRSVVVSEVELFAPATMKIPI